RGVHGAARLLDDGPRPREGRPGVQDDVRGGRVAALAVLRRRRREQRSAGRLELPRGDADGGDDHRRGRHGLGDAVAHRLQAVQRSEAQPVLRGPAGDPAQGWLVWTVYLVRCADDTLYCGITNDLAGRLAAHEAGKGAKYTRGRGPLVVVATRR